MTENEWYSCSNPWRMLELVYDKSTARKDRLFACACVRRIWGLLVGPASRKAVEIAECFAEQKAAAESLVDMHRQAIAVVREICVSRADFSPHSHKALVHAAQAAVHAATVSDLIETDAIREASGAAVYAVEEETWMNSDEPHPLLAARVNREWSAQADLLRDLFGPLPFRPVGLPPSAHSADLREIAEAIYEERCLPSGSLSESGLAVLADALEEAGVTDQDILGHLRQPGAVHVRGCFVVDLILGKE